MSDPLADMRFALARLCVIAVVRPARRLIAWMEGMIRS